MVQSCISFPLLALITACTQAAADGSGSASVAKELLLDSLYLMQIKASSVMRPTIHIFSPEERASAAQRIKGIHTGGEADINTTGAAIAANHTGNVSTEQGGDGANATTNQGGDAEDGNETETDVDNETSIVGDNATEAAAENETGEGEENSNETGNETDDVGEDGNETEAETANETDDLGENETDDAEHNATGTAGDNENDTAEENESDTEGGNWTSETSNNEEVTEESAQITYYSDVQCMEPLTVVTHALRTCLNSSRVWCGKDGLHIRAFKPGACEEKIDDGLVLPYNTCVNRGFVSMRATGGCDCQIDPSNCTVYGDPHVFGFDKGDVNFMFSSEKRMEEDRQTTLPPGDYWLVKSKEVFIQARYQPVVYPNAKSQANTYVTGLAIGGPFLEGNTLTIEPRSGQVRWLWPGGKAFDVCAKIPYTFRLDGLINAYYHNRTQNSEHPDWHNSPGIDIELPRNVKLVVNRLQKHLNVIIEMTPDAGGSGGVDGQCGNFNGNAADDTAELISTRDAGQQVLPHEVLFDRAGTEVEEKGIRTERSADELCEVQGKNTAWKVEDDPVVVTYYQDPNCEIPLSMAPVMPDQCHGHGYTLHCTATGEVQQTIYETDACNGHAVEEVTVKAGNCYQLGTLSYRISEGCGYTTCSSCSINSSGPYLLHVKDCKDEKNISVFSLDTDSCQMGWNLTCGCSSSGDKVIVAEHYSPSCAHRTSTEITEYPIGPCLLGMGSIQATDDTWNGGTIFDDGGICPDCDAAPAFFSSRPTISGFDNDAGQYIDLVRAMDSQLADSKLTNLFWMDEDQEGVPAPEGDFWLVKSRLISIQGRYRSDRSHTYLSAIAIGGFFLKGNVLTVEALDGQLLWRCQAGKSKSEILTTNGTDFQVEGLLHASRTDSEDGTQELVANFTRKVQLRVTRKAKHLDVDISVPEAAPGVEGVDGMCGNFNGDSSDDSTAVVQGRLALQVPEGDSMFEAPMG